MSVKWLLCGCVVVLLAAPSTVKAACSGDCVDDGAVTVDELVTMVNVALGAASISQCAAGDLNGDAAVTVDEIIVAVGNGLAGCPATWPDLEKATGVVHSTLAALVTLLIDIPVVGPESSVAAAGSGAVVQPCDLGGTINASCRESGGNSTLSATFSNCRLPDDGGVGTTNGTLVAVVGTRGVCSTGVIPDNVRVASTFTNFVTTVADAGGAFIASIALPSFTEVLDAQGTGCAGPNGTFSLNGSFAITQPGIGIDLTGTAHTLGLVVTSSGLPCVGAVTADGSLDLGDRRNGRNFSVSFAATHATFQEDANGDMLGAIDGGMTVDCIGNIEVTTDALVRLPDGGCATEGRLSIGLADGASGRVYFTPPGGVALDANADGIPEHVVAECHDAALAQCQ